jgi:hypothetical protein
MKLSFDSSSFDQAIAAARVKLQTKSEKLVKTFGKYFVQNTKQVAMKSAPTEDAIRSKFASLAGRIKYRGKVRKNIPRYQREEAELRRRIKVRGTFAKGWKFWRFEKSKTGMKYFIKDSVGYAQIVDAKVHPADIAARRLESRYRDALQKLIPPL